VLTICGCERKSKWNQKFNFRTYLTSDVTRGDVVGVVTLPALTVFIYYMYIIKCWEIKYFLYDHTELYKLLYTVIYIYIYIRNDIPIY